MDSWIIGTKLFILLYFVVRFASGNMDNGAFILLSMLVYICVNMFFYIFKRETIKRILLIISFLLLFVSAQFVNMLFILLLPLNGAEIVSRYSKSAWATVLPAVIAMVLLKGDYFHEYILTGFFSILIFILAQKTYLRISFLIKENDHLRDKNIELNQRLDVSSDYESRIIYQTQIEERNNLAQKIHDKVGHAIAGSLIQLEAASVIIESDAKKSRDMINNVISVLKEGMENIRATLRNIKPAPEQLGINRLKAVLDEFAFNNPIKTGLSYKGNISLISHLQWSIIMDNLREALTNSLKYSSASTIKVEVEVMNKLIKIEIRDDGTGAFSFKKGLGLKGMEERSENAGGKLIIDGTNGFSIITILPLM